MAKRKSRAFTTIAMIGVLGFLLGFFLYMWGYDYKIQRPQDFTAPRTLRGMLNIDQKGEYGYSGPVAVLTLNNSTTTRLRILNTRQIFPLYNLKLEIENEAGVWQDIPIPPETMKRYSSVLTKSEIYDKENDAISELVAGSGATRAFSLQFLFSLRENAHYKLTLTYQPEKVAEIMGDTFELIDVTRESVTLMATFDYPEKKAPVPHAPVEAKEPPKTPEATEPQKPAGKDEPKPKSRPGEAGVDD